MEAAEAASALAERVETKIIRFICFGWPKGSRGLCCEFIWTSGALGERRRSREWNVENWVIYKVSLPILRGCQ